MAKNKISDYDGVTAGNNTDIGGISTAEGMLPSTVNNAMRELTKQLGAFADGTDGIDVLNLHDDDESASIKIQAPATVTTTTTLTLPDGAGSNGQVLTTNGSGTLSWTTASSGISNVVEDTTPQLGGNLDTNGNDINFGDNDKAIFGAGNDLQIYHDGTDSVIKDTGTGNLVLTSNGGGIFFRNNEETETYANFNNNGSVQLRYDNSPKLDTTSSGIDVTGTVTADGITSSQDINITESIPQLNLNDTDGTDQKGTIAQAGANLFLRSRGGTSSYGGIQFARNNGSDLKVFQTAASGDISFFADNGTTQGLFWDASAQSLGLGVTTNSHALTVDGQVRIGNGDSGTSDMVLKAATNTGISVGGSTQAAIVTTNGTSTSSVHVGIEVPSNDSDDGFYIATDSDNDGVVDTLAMKINAAGNVGIGTSSPASKLNVDGTVYFNKTASGDYTSGFEWQGNNGALVLYRNTGVTMLVGRSDNGEAIRFNRGTSDVGSIDLGTSSTSYNTSSDHRLKENVADMTGAIARVKQLSPKRFSWIIDDEDSANVDGFLAHEAQTVVPESVTGTHNEVDGDGNPVYQGIDQSKLVPLLTGALKEAITKIEALETEMTALKARVTTLENA